MVLHKAGYFCGELVMDVLRIHRYLFTVTSAQIMTGFTPVYIAARAIDEDVQSRFYDPVNHKNVNQFSHTVHQIARFGVGIPMAALASLMFFAPSIEMRTTARVFAIGWPFVHFTKDLIKKIDTKACLRPWHELYSCKNRNTGGFPSGHMANITYTASLWWLRYGPKWGAPLACGAGFVFANFVNCNRHYMSQLIAGAGLGLIYAFSANAVIEQKLSERFSCSLHSDENGRTVMSVGYQF